MGKLLGTDWQDEYIKYYRSRTAPDDAQFWDGRAKDFSHYARTSAYAETFIKYLELSGSVGKAANVGIPANIDGEPVGSAGDAVDSASAPVSYSFLDMGSGSGTLAIPLARLGHSVIAADFSPGMLAELERSAASEGLQSVTTMQLDFNAPWSDWQRAGLGEGCVDMALASRSTIVEDMWAAFEKLERVARKKVAVTLATGNGPRVALRLGEAMAGSQGDIAFVPDYVFALNILFQMDRQPALRYIDANKRDKAGNMQHVRWAFISWDVMR